MVRTRLLALACSALALVAASGCSPQQVPRPRTAHTAPAPARFGSYAALGDSYTAAPFVGQTDVSEGCFRSDHDYPTLLAESEHIAHVTDVSCSGATTDDVMHSSHANGSDVALPPQLDAVRPDTALVTIGIGGNDAGLFAALSHNCPVTTPQGRRTEPAGRCGDVDEAALAGPIAQVGRNVGRTLEAIHARAPRATVVLVGYPRLVDRHGCPPVLPVADADAVVLDRVTRRLRDVMRSAARRTHSVFVDLYAASRGHDACSPSPWVNGVSGRPGVAMPLHPLLAGQQAAARLVARVLARQPAATVTD